MTFAQTIITTSTCMQNQARQFIFIRHYLRLYYSNHDQKQKFYQQFKRMQEIFEGQKKQILTLETQRQNLKCLDKAKADFVCVNPQCQISGLMCSNAKCQCIKKHSKCSYIHINKFFDIIREHEKKLPQIFKESYKKVHSIINGLIQQLSEIKRKLDLEEKFFRMSRQQLFLMSVIDQQDIDKICNKICGKVVSKLKNSSKSDIIYTIDSHEDITQDFKLKKADLNVLFKYIENHYMKYQKGFLGNSKIIQQQSQKEAMQKWLSETSCKKDFQAKLLFRASEHNFSSSEFHKHCDKLQNTLVIAQTEFDKVIGGFTPNKWYSPGRQEFVNDRTEKTFMFSLTLNEKYKCKDPKKSITCNKSWGPIFGGGYDLRLGASNDEKSSAYFPFSYNLQLKGIDKYERNQQTWSLFSGATHGHEFKIKQYEVYQIEGM